MLKKIDNIKSEILKFEANTKEELESFRLKFISKKSTVSALFAEFKHVSEDKRKDFGTALNDLKNEASLRFKQLIAKVDKKEYQKEFDVIDPTLTSIPFQSGGLHPISIVKNRIIQIFERQGFNVKEGPEIEDDWHNFTALNFLKNHPAREMQDTYFIEKDPDILLRTHTSTVQIRLMANHKPPFRSIMPGRVYRNEAVSARAHCFFHQLEGLYVDKTVGFKDLKQTLYFFAREFFGKNTQIRFRPSFFPFTEPSAELDISCFMCRGDGCKICKHTGWVEIGGSGMVDPNVLENCHINPDIYSGFAFGIGIERMTMLKYQIEDLRLFSDNDIRFLRQFKSA